jgi:hypothetical protein
LKNKLKLNFKFFKWLKKRKFFSVN